MTTNYPSDEVLNAVARNLHQDRCLNHRMTEIQALAREKMAAVLDGEDFSGITDDLLLQERAWFLEEVYRVISYMLASAGKPQVMRNRLPSEPPVKPPPPPTATRRDEKPTQ